MTNLVKRVNAAMLAALTAGSFLLWGCGTQMSESERSENQKPADAAAEANVSESTEGTAADQTPEGGSLEESLTDRGTLDYTWLIDMGELAEYYEEYEDGPIYKYWSSMEWNVPSDGEKGKIAVDFTAPPADNKTDYVNTLLATGEYPDVMMTSLSSESVPELYEEGIALDLTEYVQKYMPNYLERVSEVSYGNQLYDTVDGEKKILQLYSFNDQAQDPWCGYLFRRDWIVKYGKDADGNAFTGGWNEDGTEWADDVVFPSGNTEPVYISDWEWMFGIFEEALEDLSEPDGYVMQLPFMGFIPFGDLSAGFGGTASWYLDEDGICRAGFAEDGFRAYMECLAAWYEKGWINQGFEENTQDAMFWSVDAANVYSGRVGCFYGMNAAIGNRLEASEPALSGICLWPAASPINDVYGSEAEQQITPFMNFASRQDPTSAILTNKVNEEEIGILLTAIDYLYSREGALLANRGFSEEQQAEIQDTFYSAHGLDNGAYSVKDNGDLLVNPILNETEGLDNAARMIRVVSFTYNSGVDMQYPQVQQIAMEEWVKYPNSGSIMGAVTGQMTPDEATAYSAASTEIRTYMSQAVPQFITGTRDIHSDADWKEYCDTIASFEPDRYSEIINRILGNP